jgi:hypothetical protein
MLRADTTLDARAAASDLAHRTRTAILSAMPHDAAATPTPSVPEAQDRE